ncbi:MAG: hypothetical protein PHD19_11735 [Dechloromonas sp.]|nr:hypothetical protein [Dechloromonas sp.]
MRKRCRRTVRREAAPTLVAYYLNPEVSTQERMAVEAIRAGYAKEAHYDMLALAAAEAIASQMYQTLLLAWTGETFLLSSTPIWVQPAAVALSVAQGGVA